MQGFMEPFSFACSNSLNYKVRVKINSLTGLQGDSLSLHENIWAWDDNIYSGLYVTAQLWGDCKPLSISVKTGWKELKGNKTWNEWFKFPVKYCNLSRSAQIAITVWRFVGTTNEKPSHASPLGGTTIGIFDEDWMLRKGRQRCKIHINRAADGLSPTKTPYQEPLNENVKTSFQGEMDRLECLMKKHEMGEIPECRWLDQMAFREIENFEKRMYEDPTRMINPNEDTIWHDLVYLLIEFPKFDLPVVFTDFEYNIPGISNRLTDHEYTSPDRINELRSCEVYDLEVDRKDNPAESKHRKLIRSHRTSPMDEDLRPNAKNRDELNAIMQYGPTRELNSEEKDLVWQYRHYLTREKRAFTKFVKSVSWQDRNEARTAVQLIPKWVDIDVEDTLELLGPSFDHKAVRAYAVERLRTSNDDDLLLYLLQLVQALKFEPKNELVDEIPLNGPSDVNLSAPYRSTKISSLAEFLVSRASKNFKLGNYLHWYLLVECDDHSASQDPSYRRSYAQVEYELMTQFLRQPDGADIRKILLRQGEFVTVLTKLSRDIRNSRQNRLQKVENLKKFVANPKHDFLRIDPPLPLPLDPTVSIVGCIPDESSVFKSTLSPLLLTFQTTQGKKYPLLFKTGDDLRQDQLVIQIINLMDKLLREENLDLKLSPYKILATSSTAGMVQFIPSLPLSTIVQKYKSILNYLQTNNPDPSANLRVLPSAMDTFIKSCAGYSVITYILGVGDRHLDNLLLTTDGHFFHADFGYILGRDPKPFAPLMKLPRELIEGMGGTLNPYFDQFKQHCFTAYTTLRKSSNLILNLFTLMIQANIPDIRCESDKVVAKVHDRFHLELSEDEAIRHFEALIADSMNAFMPVVIDRLHGFVQNWRV